MIRFTNYRTHGEYKSPSPFNYDDEVETVICSYCSGSGQGRSPSSTCTACAGSGELPLEDIEPYDDGDDYYHVD